MGFEDTDDGDVGIQISTVSCSICLESVSDKGDRSWANLLCGHRFHLDCIGSAFNVKGAMQCPNCRKVEKGQWLYANGGRAFPEFHMEDWVHDEDLNDILMRCEGEFSSNGYHDLLGQHAMSSENAPVSSGSHPCPYIAYVSPVNPTSSNLGTSISDNSHFNNYWTGNEVPTSYAFPTMDVHYHSWDHLSPPFLASSDHSGFGEQTSFPSICQRSSRSNGDLPRTMSFMQPLHIGHSSGARAGSSLSSSTTPPYPGAMPGHKIGCKLFRHTISNPI